MNLMKAEASLVVLASVAFHLAVLGLVLGLSPARPPVAHRPPAFFIDEVLFQKEEPAKTFPKPRPPRPAASTPLPQPVTEASVPVVSPPPAVETELPPQKAAVQEEPGPRPAPVVVPAALVSIQKPKYPPRLRTLGVEGLVRLEVKVSPEGRCLEAAVVRSSGYPEMDSRALDAVRKASFSPQTLDTVACVGTLKLTIRYSLE